MKFWEELIAYFPLIRHGQHKIDVSNNSVIVASVFISAVKLLPCRCLGTIGRFTCRHRDRWERFKKYAAEKDSGAMIYTPSSVKICVGIEKLIWETYGHARQHGDLINLLLFYQNMEIRLNIFMSAICKHRLWYIFVLRLDTLKFKHIS
jgi:hypothetical protein